MIPVILALMSCLLSFQDGRGAEQSTAGTISVQTLAYTMRGEVRFLLFWIGRDNVGGGRISLARAAGGDAGQTSKEVEVLFGSNPERVPGKVNLWGYGKESSIWKQSQNSGPELVQSVFLGFMRPTEDQPQNVQDYLKTRKSEGSFLYKSIRSEVTDKSATTEIRFFFENQDFNYRAPESLLSKYQQNLISTPAAIRRELPRASADYEVPAGFLTAAQSLVTRICEQAVREPRGWTAFRPTMRYAFHAKPYRLVVRKIAVAQNFHTPAVGTSGTALQNVAIVDFRIENLKQALTEDFTLWFTVDGPLQGLPLRIVYQPKWWLRLKLDLTGVTNQN